MQVLIADSGATKTSWALCTKLGVSMIQTSGMNPHLKSDDELESVINSELKPQLSSNKINEIYFYGAGCKAIEKSRRMRNIFDESFPKATVYVQTDIEGAGLSVFGKKEGIVVISGTGSSAGLMKDGELIEIMPMKAYPEGDFGSGSHIGALVLHDYFEGKVPHEVKMAIEKDKSINVEERLSLFQNLDSSKQIAAKAMIDVGSLKNTKYLKDKAKLSIEMLIKPLKKYFGDKLIQHSISMVGSTAFYFKDVFREQFQKNDIKIEEIQQNPIQGLINYHTKRL